MTTTLLLSSEGPIESGKSLPSKVMKEKLMNQETSTYAMSIAEIAANLGVSERAVRFILCRAIFKLRSHPQRWTSFRAAVEERRRAQDARRGTVPGTTQDRLGSVPKVTSHRNFFLR